MFLRRRNQPLIADASSNASSPRKGRGTRKPQDEILVPRPVALNSGEEEKKYPRMSRMVEGIALYVSSTGASMVLLPISVRKTFAQVPRAYLARSVLSPLDARSFQSGLNAVARNFSGASSVMAETAVRFAATLVLPPPVAALVTYLCAVPIQSRIVRAQALLSAPLRARRWPSVMLSRRGLGAVWKSHILKDFPFTCIEAYVLAAIVLRSGRRGKQSADQQAPGATRAIADAPPSSFKSRRREKRRNTPSNEKASSNNKSQGNKTSPSSGPQDGRVHPVDAIIAGTVAGVLTSPMDAIRTRMLISTHPSLRRTSTAMIRSMRIRGVSRTLIPRGAGYHIAECIARPLAFLALYAGCRASLMTAFLHWRRSAEVAKEIVNLQEQEANKRK